MGKRKRGMGHSSIPGRLDILIDDVSPGTILKNLVDDHHWAMIVDFIGDSLDVIAVEVRKKIRDGEEEPEGWRDYSLFIVEKHEEWLVMALGNDYDLVE